MGWNGSDLNSSSIASNRRSGSSASPHSNGVRNGLVALVLIALIGGAAWWFLSTPMPQPPPPAPETDATPAAPVERVAARDDDTPAVEKTAPEPVAHITKRPETPAEISQEENQLSAVPTNAVKPKKKGTFKNGTDQLIAMVMSAPEGTLMPPLPHIGKGDTQRFIDTLSTPIEINESDSEAVKAIKETVQDVRKQIAQLMIDNPEMEFGEILEEHRANHNHQSKIQGDIQNELRQFVSDGKIEEALEFRKTMNDALGQMGMPPVEFPITDEEKAEAGVEDEEEE